MSPPSAPDRPRVGLLVPRFTVFDGALGEERVAALRARAAALAAVLEPVADVILEAVEDDAGAARARAAFAAAHLDAVVVAPAMAAPPSLGAAVLAPPSPPALLWNAIGTGGLDDDAVQPEAIRHTTTVGCQMLAGALARLGLHAPVVTTGPDDAVGVARLHVAVRAVSAAGAVRGGSLLRVGEPPPGYLNVACDDGDLARLGLRLAPVGGEELDEAFAAVEEAQAGALLRELATAGVGRGEGVDAARSARLAVAIGALLDRHGALAGSVACTGPLVAANPRIGVPACLAGAVETARGRPLSCTGDVPAALALWLGRRLAGAALYVEWYLSQPAAGDALLLSCGLADPAWAQPGSAALYPVAALPGVQGVAAGVRFAPRLGPATLLGLSAAHDGWRLAWLQGAVEGAGSTRLRGVAVRFRPAAVDPLAAASGWIETGVTHHPVLLPGHHGPALALLAGALGARALEVAA